MIIGVQCNDSGVSFAEKDKEELPWLGVDGDLDWFKYITNGQILVVGSKTAATLPPLKNREVWVMSSSGDLNSVEKVLEKYEAEGNGRNLMIGGGESVWEAFRPYYDSFYVTFLKEQYVPEGKKRQWLPNSDSRRYSAIILNKKYTVSIVLKEDIKKP